MGRRYRKDTQIYELNADFICQTSPQILTNSTISTIIQNDPFKKAVIILPANNIRTLEGEKLEVISKSENAFTNGQISKKCLLKNYFAQILSDFQTSNYLEFTIISPNGFQRYTPRSEIVEFYKQNSNLENPNTSIRLEQINPEGSLSSNFQISQIKTAQDLQRFQTLNQPKPHYLSLGQLIQKNPLVNLDPRYIEQMSLRFLENLHNFRTDDPKSRQMKAGFRLGKEPNVTLVRESLEFKLDENQIPKVIF